MTKDEALKWLNRYNTEEDLYNTGLEERLRSSFKKQGHMTKEQLLQIVEWKFKTMPGREKRERNLLKDIAENDIRLISAAVFGVKEDKLRLKLLSAIPGVGLAMASTVMTFYEPESYGIYDIHSWRGLMRSRESKSAVWSDLEEFWTALRNEAKKFGMSCRDLEKAYFKKDKEEPLE